MNRQPRSQDELRATSDVRVQNDGHVLINGHDFGAIDPASIRFTDPRTYESWPPDWMAPAGVLSLIVSPASTLLGVALANPWVWGAGALGVTAGLVLLVLDWWWAR